MSTLLKTNITEFAAPRCYRRVRKRKALRCIREIVSDSANQVEIETSLSRYQAKEVREIDAGREAAKGSVGREDPRQLSANGEEGPILVGHRRPV
jgi:hypothetical protein